MAFAVFYAVVNWLPVGFLAGDPGTFGSRGWPMVSPAVTAAVSVAVVALVWGVFRRRRCPAWMCAVLVVAALVLAAAVQVRWFGHYAAASDRATALEIGWRELVAGRNPYLAETQLNNPIAPMLGGILLAGPFVAVAGSLAWYGLFWFAVALVVVWRWAGPNASAAAAVVAVVSPAFRLELYAESDAWVDALYLVLFGAVGFAVARRTTLRPRWVAGRVVGAPGWARPVLLLVGALFGVALAYRFIYAAVALPLVVLMWRRFGAAVAAWFAVPAALVGGVLAVVPAVIDHTVYAPLHTADRADSSVIPFFLPALAGVVLLVLLVGAWQARTIGHAWTTITTALSLMVLIVAWGHADLTSYETVAYNGGILTFALAAVLAPREPDVLLPLTAEDRLLPRPGADHRGRRQATAAAR